MNVEADTSRGDKAQLPALALAALQRNNKIEAIKIVRENLGIGLKEAKDFVEACIDSDVALQTQMRANGPQMTGGRLLRLLSVAALVVIVFLWWKNG